MQRTTHPRATRPFALLLGLALVCAGCRERISGTWTDESGLGRLEFRQDGTVYVTTFGGTIACTYEVDGDHVLVQGENGTQVLLRDGDRLDGGLGQTFVRR